jgi:arylsulfatase A-like enzyme
MTQGFDHTEQFNDTRFRFCIYRALVLLGVIEKPEYAREAARAAEVTDAALRWLDRFHDEDPFFLFAHYMNVHHPYLPPPRYEEMFRSSPEAGAIDPHALFEKTKRLVNDPPPIDFGGVELERLIDLYDGCIRSADEQIGRLIDAVQQRSRSAGRETVVVFTADHGDEFMEHGSLYHTNLIYPELLRVPLILSAPGSVEPGRVDAMARHIDVLPTIADLAGAQTPDSVTGRSLLPLVGGGRDDAPTVSFAEGDFCTAMIYDHWQIMTVDTSDALVLFDLANDPLGLVDVADQYPKVVAELGPMVTDYAAMAARRRVERSEATEETVRQLRALGYVN